MSLEPGERDAEAPAETPPEPVQVGPATSLRILLAEDNAINQTVVKEILEALGHRVTVAGNGQEAVEHWAEGDFDVILMDAQMPVMDGYAACREIRRREAAAGRPPVPIIALTAHALEEDRTACLEAGMDDYLPKPLSIAALETALRRLPRTDRPRLRLIQR